MQSAKDQNAGLHVAVIMDGNGRWRGGAGCRWLRRHHAGVQAVRRVGKPPTVWRHHATLVAFSSDNWRRPAQEVRVLMSLRKYLRADLASVDSGRASPSSVVATGCRRA